MFLKVRMVESSLMLKGDPLTPNIDKKIHMAIWFFRRRALTMKIGKNGLLEFGIYIFSSHEKRNLSKTTSTVSFEVDTTNEIIAIKIYSVEPL